MKPFSFLHQHERLTNDDRDLLYAYDLDDIVIHNTRMFSTNISAFEIFEQKPYSVYFMNIVIGCELSWNRTEHNLTIIPSNTGLVGIDIDPDHYNTELFFYKKQYELDTLKPEFVCKPNITDSIKELNAFLQITRN